mgnify:CR=1 FL=1
MRQGPVHRHRLPGPAGAWFFIGRITFAYHYFPSVLFLVLALCYVFYSLSEQEELIAWKPAMYAVTAGAAASTPCSIPCWWHPDPLLVWDLPAAVAPLLALLIPRPAALVR